MGSGKMTGKEAGMMRNAAAPWVRRTNDKDLHLAVSVVWEWRTVLLQAKGSRPVRSLILRDELPDGVLIIVLLRFTDHLAEKPYGYKLDPYNNQHDTAEKKRTVAQRGFSEEP